MGFRFRKTVRLFPGLRLNVTKHGINSVSLGGRGLSYNIGKKGARGTLSKPGTGLSYSNYQSYDEKPSREHVDLETGEVTQSPAKPGIPWGLVALIALVVLGVYFLRGSA